MGRNKKKIKKKNNWENLLDKEIEKKLKKTFYNEMKELNYI